MKTFFLSQILLFVSCFAFADPTIILEPELSRKVSNTSYLKNNIYSIGFLNSSCTGAQISKEGHILLARHCIESVIEWGNLRGQNKGISFSVEETLVTQPPLIKYSYQIPALKNQLSFHVGFDDKFVPASIFAIGPGMLFPRFSIEAPEDQRKLHNSFTNLGYSDGGDIAIVLIPSLAGRSCLKLASKVLNENEPVRTISYPCFKDERYDWPQERKGEVLLSTNDDSMVIHDFPVSKGNFLINHKTQSCNSGSPVFNRDGEIAGVVHVSLSDEGSGMTMAAHVLRLFDFMDVSDKINLLELNQSCETFRED